MSAPLQLRLAFSGSLHTSLDRGRRILADAVRNATEFSGKQGQERLRDDVVNHLRGGANHAGGELKSKAGKGLSKSWRMKIYPERGSQSLDAAAWIYSTAPDIINAFDLAVTITVKNSKYLAIPTGFAKALSSRTKGGDGVDGGKSRVAAAIARFGTLRFAPFRNKPGGFLLAPASALTKRQKRDAGRRRASVLRPDARAGAFDWVVVFVLVPKARMPKLLHSRDIMARLSRDFPRHVASRLDHELGMAFAKADSAAASWRRAA